MSIIYLLPIDGMVAIYNETELINNIPSPLEYITVVHAALVSVGYKVKILSEGVELGKKEHPLFPWSGDDKDKSIRIPQSTTELLEFIKQVKEDSKRERIKFLWAELNRLMIEE